MDKETEAECFDRLRKDAEKNADPALHNIKLMELCPEDGEHKGKPCACAGCRHVDGVCIDHDSGSGCHCCEGPVEWSECDLTLYDEEKEWEVRFCDKCLQLTNHDPDGCLKCRAKMKVIDFP